MTEITGLTKLTVNLTPRALDALAVAAERCGDSRTDTVNRALQLYDVVTAIATQPGTFAEVQFLPGVTHRVTARRLRWWHWRPFSAEVASSPHVGPPAAPVEPEGTPDGRL